MSEKISQFADGTGPESGDLVVVARGSGNAKLSVDELFAAINSPYNAKLYGAVGDKVADDRAAIQSAIDAAHAAYLSSGRVQIAYLPPGVYLVGSAGTYGGRGFSLLMKSGVSLVGAGAQATTIYAANGNNGDVITTLSAAGATSSITLKGFTVDGNEANQTDTAYARNFELYQVTDLVMHDIASIHPSEWCCAIDTCNRVRISDYYAYGDSNTNADCLHFIDTNDVTGTNLWLYNNSDDALAIEARDASFHGYAITGLHVAGCVGRAVWMGSDTTHVSGAWTMSNIDIEGTFYGSGMAAVSLDGASYQNVNIKSVSRNCKSDLYLHPGNSLYAGALNGCSFDINGVNAVGGGGASSVQVDATDGTPDANRINAKIYNPADGVAAVVLYGTRWNGDIAVRYNPTGTKVSKMEGVKVFGNYSNLSVVCPDADVGLRVLSGATANTFHLGVFTSNATNDLQVDAGATYNNFIGGYVATYVNNGGTTNRFLGVYNAEQTAVGTAAGYTAGTTVGTFHTDDKYSGNIGATSYTINGIVAALKAVGILHS